MRREKWKRKAVPAILAAGLVLALSGLAMAAGTGDETQIVSEAESESVAKVVDKAESGSAGETVDKAESESETEAVGQGDTAGETEAVSEAETESGTEAVNGAGTESGTAAPSEAETEAESESESELDGSGVSMDAYDDIISFYSVDDSIPSYKDYVQQFDQSSPSAEVKMGAAELVRYEEEGFAFSRPFLNAIEPAILNAISEESTSWKLPS